MKGKWMFNLDDNEIWQGDEFDTKEEAIKAGIEELEKPENEGYYSNNFQVGQITEVPVSGVDVESILDNVAENTTCECGEVGEGYLYDIADEHLNELEQKLNDVLFAWMEKYDYEPDFYIIENTETIEL